MMFVNKTHRNSKSRIKCLGFLLIVLNIPLIFNSHIFNIFEHEDDVKDEDINNDHNKINPILSSNHPINADDFKYYKAITIDHTKVSGTENLIDFPVLISIFDSDLHDNTQSDGDDIAFSNNFQWLDHEIELYNQTYNTTHAHLVAWVRIPVLSTTDDTKIRMYYGNPYIDSRENPTGVWNENYKGVWHLEEDPSGISPQIKDSTSNGNDGTSGGSMSS
ncbi:MAG: DUF2341 domain-containing protein [Promethearchaeota archaeon]|jgi:hypothetical protein